LTLLEKYLRKCPDADPDFVIRSLCPDWEEVGDKPDWCGNGEDGLHKCSDCWNRGIPEDKPVADAFTQAGTSAMTATEAVQRMAEAAKYMPPTIKDSGNRREFDTGAVRDIQEGKGRCDLMPLDVVTTLIPAQGNHHRPMVYVADFVNTGDTVNLLGALQRFYELHGWDLPTMLLEVAKHFEAGAKKYGEHNWQKGIPVKCYIDSAVRHYLKWLRGDEDEPHDRAFCWNIMCAIWTCKHKPELNDYKHEVPTGENTCVCCGRVIPEGQQVCSECMKG